MHFKIYDFLHGFVLLGVTQSFYAINIDNFKVSTDILVNLLDSISSDRGELEFQLIEASDQLPNIANHLDLSQSRVENVLELIHSARESEGARINDDAIWSDLNELAAWQADSSFLLQAIGNYFDLLSKKLNTMSISIEKLSSNLREVNVDLAVQLIESHRINSKSIQTWKENFRSDEYRMNFSSKVSSTLQRLYYEANLLNTTTSSLAVDMFQQTVEIIKPNSLSILDTDENYTEKSISEHQSNPGLDDLTSEPTCSCSCDTFNVSFVELVVREVVTDELSTLVDNIQDSTSSVSVVDDAFMHELCGAPLHCDPCPENSISNISISSFSPFDCNCDIINATNVIFDVVKDGDEIGVSVAAAAVPEINVIDFDGDNEEVDLRAIAAAAPQLCQPPLVVLEEQSAATYMPESLFLTISPYMVWKSFVLMLGQQHQSFLLTSSISTWLQHHSQYYFIHLPVHKSLFQLLKLKLAGVGTHSLAVDGNISLGSCWPLQGSAGNVTVELSYGVSLSHISINHVSRKDAIDISTAPKEFEIYGSKYRNGPFEYLGQGMYDIQSEDAMQYFSVLESPLVKFVTVKVINNYGSPLYTCIYDMQVFGYAQL